MVITQIVEAYKAENKNICKKVRHNMGIKKKVHKKVKKHIDNLFKAYYNEVKQIVELFKILAEFRDGFNNVLSAFRHWMLLII